MANKKLNSQQKKVTRQFRTIGCLLFVFVLLLGALLGLLVPLRPDVSKAENRTLTKFPEFSLETFLNGEYFSDISTWYSDTFPLRDPLITANQKITALYGIKGEEQVIGTDLQADEIPTETSTIQPSSSQAAAPQSDVEESSQTESQTESKEPVLPDSYQMEEAVQNQIQKYMYVKDGAAYSIYGFSQAAADTYTQALSNAASELAGQTNVYSILVPLNSGVMLDEQTLKSLGGSDQTQAIDYYYNSYKGVTGIETIRTLREHNSEYLYFRTDHHWTALGAYYVYRNFCEAKGWTPNELSSFETMTFSPFLGTFYSALNKPADMLNNPDYVTAYIPHGTNTMTFEDKNGTKYDWKVIRDVSKEGAGSGYYTFIGGDNPMSVIQNPNINDGSSCLVVKESYGNCFVPFLVDHYQTIYVVDFRYAKVNVLDFVKENQIKDLIIMNNIGIVNSEKVATTIKGLL